MIVEVTQYYRPDGRQRTHELEISDDCAEKYKQIRAVGCRLTAEQLMSLEVSQTIEHKEGDYDLILTKGNDFDENKKALETMIRRFDDKKFASWLPEAESEV
jgi:hypothetical protein